MSGPDLLERARMCLAEVGIDPHLVVEPSAERKAVGATLAWHIDIEWKAAWRAGSIARGMDGLFTCWECHPKQRPVRVEQIKAARDACLATRPCMEDCGLDRSAS